MMTENIITTLVFDWGNTLMKVFPQYSGVMAEWPEVAAVEGTYEALAALQGQFRLLVATNASDSNAAQITAALERVGLSNYFQNISTYHELRARKPDLAFFRALQTLTGDPVEHLVMVGDDYLADISGAWHAGWRTIWFNPEEKTAPALLPIHSAEITRFEQLPAALQKLNLPGIDTCLAWMFQAGTSANLLAHVQMTATLAYRMALWLRSAGQSVDPLLAHRAGLLHDLAKLSPIHEPDHAEQAAQILRERGLPEMAEIVYRHIMSNITDPQRAPLTWEQKVVFLADKLVENGQPVELETRLDALRQRYPAYRDRINAQSMHVYVLQEEICHGIGIAPTDLVENLKKSLRD